jgi:hypothetical protein
MDQYVLPLPYPRQCSSNEGGGRVKAEAMKRAIVMATKVASNDNGDGNSGMSNGNGDKGGGRATTRAMAAATTGMVQANVGQKLV